MLKRFFATGKDQPLLEDQSEIDRSYRRNRLQVMLAITLGYGMAYTCRLPLAIVKKPLINEGIFNAEQLGLIGSALLYGYGLGKLFNGFLVDYANVKRFFSVGLFLSALANLLMGGNGAVSLGFWMALWALNGWFQGFGAPASATVLSNWFSNRERGTYYGIWSTAHAIGEGLTFYVTAAVVAWLGWRAGFWGPGLLCVVTALGLYIFLRDRPQTMGLPPVARWQKDEGPLREGVETQPLSRKEAQWLVLKSPAIWVMGLSNATMYVTRYAINNWGILYLQEARGYSLPVAGLFLTVNTVAGIVGSIIYGLVSDRFFAARRPPANLIFGLMEIVALFVIFFAPPHQPILLGTAYALYGFSLSGILASLGGLFAIDLAPKKAAGAAMGFIGVFGYLGAAIQDQISGYLIQRNSTAIPFCDLSHPSFSTMLGIVEGAVPGMRLYDFSTPIVFWIGSSVVSLLLATTLWRVQPRD